MQLSPVMPCNPDKKYVKHVIYLSIDKDIDDFDHESHKILYSYQLINRQLITKPKQNVCFSFLAGFLALM